MPIHKPPIVLFNNIIQYTILSLKKFNLLWRQYDLHLQGGICMGDRCLRQALVYKKLLRINILFFMLGF